MQSLIDQLSMFYEQNSAFCMAAAAVLLLLLLWKTKKVMKGIVLVLFLGLLVYAAVQLVDSINFGSSLKKSGIERTEKALNE